MVKSGSTYLYEYYLKDHLGNNRSGFAAGINVTAPNFSADYYPFGMQYQQYARTGNPKNNYLYNGKELQDGLKLYDYGARLYDPVIGRWGTIDPLAEQYSNVSPYNYALNNPIKYIDPDGRSISDPKEIQNLLNNAKMWAAMSDEDEDEDQDDPKKKKNNPPSFLNNKYLNATAKLFAGRHVENMKEALDTYEREGIKGYINHSIGNAHREIGFDFQMGAYGPFRGSGRSPRSTVGIGLADDFLASATKSVGKQGLTNVGRALQKHAGREGSVFQGIKFSHKTGNQEGLNILNQIMSSKNQIIRPAENGGKLIFDKATGRGFGVSRDGLFNGFREVPK